jgi:hypothetical protein
MEKNELQGFWILKSRHESPDDGINTISFDFGARRYNYEFVNPEIEILYFSSSACYQLGLERLCDQNKDKYEITSHVPGTYDPENSIVKLIDKGTFYILSDGDLQITVIEKNYYCKEIWGRMANEQDDMLYFVSELIRNFGLC